MMRRNAVNVDVIKSLWFIDPVEMPSAEIARRIGVSKTQLHILRQRIGLPPRKRVSPNRGKSGGIGRRKQIDLQLLFRLWHMPASEMPSPEISRRLGITGTYLYLLKQRHKLPQRERVYHYDEDDPSEEEIAARAAEIRDGWPEGEAEKRLVGGRVSHWTPPNMHYDRRDSVFQLRGKSVDV